MSDAAVPPGTAQSGAGWWVYGVVPSATAGDNAFPDIVGVDQEGNVDLFAEGDLAAIVSSVPLEDFGEGAIEQNLHDEPWLEQKVRAHEDVLEAALARTPLVPFRFGTIYRSEDQVRGMLRENAYLTGTLERLRGTTELGVKAFLDTSEFERARAGDAGAEPSPSGRAYLVRKQLDQRIEADRASFKASCAQRSHERLSAVAEDARANPLQQPDVSGRTGEMLLNGAYLVRVEQAEVFTDAIDALQSSYRSDGVRYELTGPWPPYNFVDVEPRP